MTIKLHLQSEATPILRQMAKAAGVGVADICEIAVYNLMALYEKDRGINQQPLDATNAVVSDS